MLRNTNNHWWNRFRTPELIPLRISEAAVARRCPDCAEQYDARDKYCPRCHSATPEWRYG